MGAQNKTISGTPCLMWLSQLILKPEERFAMVGQAFPDTITDEHNYCRNPTAKQGGPWCKVADPTDSGEDWEYCDVRFCVAENAKKKCKTEEQCASSE